MVNLLFSKPARMGMANLVFGDDDLPPEPAQVQVRVRVGGAWLPAVVKRRTAGAWSAATVRARANGAWTPP